MPHKKIGFLVDLPMVFSVVKLDDLVVAANKYYNSNIFTPTVGSFGYSKDELGETKVFFLYKITAKKLDYSEKISVGEMGNFNTKIEKIGGFSNLYEILNNANTMTIFQSLDEANVFLRAIIKSDSKMDSYSAFICLDYEIDGI